ncbi:alpha/beta hydrolase [Dictyobacter kobayashii]|uniref:Alpha/beta hydrolase n=1 Tax=Dictyobacter kobayashii TaxID=2014872 RepID=A0A402AB78_9CHLR|nr:alpha/beta hydrolase [Dictyobacter kobayashii]
MQIQNKDQLPESTLQTETINTGNSSILSSSTKSDLFQLTNGLRPGQSKPIPAAKDVQEIPVFDVSFYNERGDLISGWLAVSTPNAPVIILAHGTPGDRVDMINRASFLFKHGYSVLLFDFQSYGKSQGVMSTLGMVESGDILAAISFLHSYPDTINSRIGLLGLSMGATASVLAAARSTDISAVLAESCPVDATRVPDDVPNDQVRDADRQLVEEVYGVDITLARPIDVVNKLTGRTAIFFVNGDSDVQTPLDGMKALYSAAGEPKQFWVVSGAGHAQSFDVAKADYETRVDQFFDTYLGF